MSECNITTVKQQFLKYIVYSVHIGVRGEVYGHIELHNKCLISSLSMRNRWQVHFQYCTPTCKRPNRLQKIWRTILFHIHAFDLRNLKGSSDS